MVRLSAPSARRHMAPDGEERRRPGGCAAILGDLGRLERWAGRDLVQLREGKGKGCCVSDKWRHRLPREMLELHPWRCSTASGHPYSHKLTRPTAPNIRAALSHRGHPPVLILPVTAYGTACVLPRQHHSSASCPTLSHLIQTPPCCDKLRGSSWKGTFGPQHLRGGIGREHSLLPGKPEL